MLLPTVSRTVLLKRTASTNNLQRVWNGPCVSGAQLKWNAGHLVEEDDFLHPKYPAHLLILLQSNLLIKQSMFKIKYHIPELNIANVKCYWSSSL